MHCASLLRTIFVSLVSANKRGHVHKVRNFPQAKLDNETNARFLLDKRRNVPFYCVKLVCNSMPFYGMTDKKNQRQVKKRYCQKCLLTLLLLIWTLPLLEDAY